EDALSRGLVRLAVEREDIPLISPARHLSGDLASNLLPVLRKREHVPVVAGLLADELQDPDRAAALDRKRSEAQELPVVVADGHDPWVGFGAPVPHPCEAPTRRHERGRV